MHMFFECIGNVIVEIKESEFERLTSSGTGD
jgi:hypothetical protein